MNTDSAVVLIQCPDQPGIIARIAALVFAKNGNIIDSDQFSSGASHGGIVFFMRLEFSFAEAHWPRRLIREEFSQLAISLSGTAQIHFRDEMLRMGVLVSRADHCLLDILYHHANGELPVTIPLIVSNHGDLEPIAARYGIPFHYIPAKPDKAKHFSGILEIVNKETDFLVLARYMQILDAAFLAAYQRPIINIHHSFLPSFKGAFPYRQAFERGVKVIGATAHFVTEDLDEGPIIEQMVERVSHRDREDDLKRKGRNLERMALDRAIRSFAGHRVIRHENKTIVFD